MSSAAESDAKGMVQQSGMPPSADLTDFRAIPTTARGRRTRAALVAGARVIFERDGYLGSRLSDIAAQAECSLGNFYTYFTDKDEILQAVMETVQNDMAIPGFTWLDEDERSPAAILRVRTRAYLESYKRNAKLIMALMQVEATDPKFRDVRRRRDHAFARRSAEAIETMQERGLVDIELAPMFAASALSAMVSGMAYHSFCLGGNDSLEDLVDICTQLWVNALRIEL